ncbi:MAG: PQQ-binding-like beta-propeller repeat protein [Verrucomicrobia bacterium]|nr:PQQ-binding-like beta-propeller repeat protein [Verrucomicrobiota bacterium]
MNLFCRFSLAFLLCLLVCPISSRASDWPQWRGPERDGHIPAGTPVPTTLASEPKVLWRLNIGGGFSSPVIQSGKLVYLDAQEGQEVAHLIDAKTGKEFWRVPFSDMYGDEWGVGPRSTPIMDGDRVYVQSCRGEFRCLNLADGKVLWGTSFTKDFGIVFVGSKVLEGTARRRGNNGSGVVDGDRIYVPVGCTDGATIVCYNKRTGAMLWKSQNDEAAFSSLMVATLAGVKHVVMLDDEALIGVNADNGKLLWRLPLETYAKRHVATPVIFGETVMVNSHTFGLLCFKIIKEGDKIKAVEKWANEDLKINIATPVVVGNYVYSHGPRKDFVCADALTGKLLWLHGGFGENYSSIIVLGKNLLVLTDLGELILIAGDPAKYTELGRTHVCGKTWSHPAFADGKLYVREGLREAWKLTSFDLIP